MATSEMKTTINKKRCPQKILTTFKNEEKLKNWRWPEKIKTSWKKFDFQNWRRHHKKDDLTKGRKLESMKRTSKMEAWYYIWELFPLGSVNERLQGYINSILNAIVYLSSAWQYEIMGGRVKWIACSLSFLSFLFFGRVLLFLTIEDRFSYCIC